MDYAQDGDLSKFTDEDIADASEWDGDPRQFIDALVYSGFIDKEGEWKHIHDWDEYVGRLIEKREYNKERMKLSRSARSARANERGDHEQPTSAHVQHAFSARSAHDVAMNTATVPNPTVPNPTVPTEPDQPPASGRHGADYPKLFDVFWQEYPKKIGKGEARKSWNRIKPTMALFEKILTSVQLAKQSGQWRRDGGRFIPNPATWLNQGRWDDEPFTAATGPPAASGNRNGVNTMNILDSIINGEEE
jgi:hypothetical protein